jgi:hypothetical protein
MFVVIFSNAPKKLKMMMRKVNSLVFSGINDQNIRKQQVKGLSLSSFSTSTNKKLMMTSLWFVVIVYD